MSYSSIKEKRKAMAHAVVAYVKIGMNKTAAVKKVADEFGYVTMNPVWSALKEFVKETEQEMEVSDGK